MLHEMSDALPACPVETTLTLISDKWKVLILRDLGRSQPKGVDITAAADGSQRPADAQGLC